MEYKGKATRTSASWDVRDGQPATALGAGWDVCEYNIPRKDSPCSRGERSPSPDAIHPSAVGPARHGREATTRLRLRLSIIVSWIRAATSHRRTDSSTRTTARATPTPDPDRAGNDKSTILGDTIQMLKDLTSQLNKLKAEYSSLSEEERELTQEKNELRDEKALLKSDVDNLNNQYQQRIQMLYQWTAMDPSVFIGPRPSFPFPVPVPIPTGPVTIHPQLQAYPLFRSQTLGAFANPPSDQPSNQFSTPVQHSGSSQSHSPAQDCRSKSSTLHHASCGGRNDGFGNIATDLELKIPGSSAHSHSELTDKDSSSELKKKECIKQINGSTHTEDSSSSRCSSVGPIDVSNSIGDG